MGDVKLTLRDRIFGTDPRFKGVWIGSGDDTHVHYPFGKPPGADDVPAHRPTLEETFERSGVRMPEALRRLSTPRPGPEAAGADQAADAAQLMAAEAAAPPPGQLAMQASGDELIEILQRKEDVGMRTSILLESSDRLGLAIDDAITAKVTSSAGGPEALVHAVQAGAPDRRSTVLSAAQAAKVELDDVFRGVLGQAENAGPAIVSSWVSHKVGVAHEAAQAAGTVLDVDGTAAAIASRLDEFVMALRTLT